MVAAMNVLVWILVATAFGGLLSALLAGSFLTLSAERRARLMPHLISFATGAMLAAALLGLLPEAVQAVGPAGVPAIGAALLGGIALFFVLEKLVLWRHCHTEDCEPHQPHDHGHGEESAAGWLILFGDSLHNVLDGVLIAAAFLTDVRLGFVTALAITAHEVPQELGGLAVLLHSGMPARRALTYNVISSLTSVIGGLAGYFALGHALEALPYAIAVAAASLLYVAVADLIPGLHKRVDPRGSLLQVLLLAVGVVVIVLTESLTGI
jgi:zinc and cadmium transporter